jgi:tetratricopeptide (TPR) repeat protein
MQLQTWKLDGAIKHFTAALDLNPQYVDALVGLGRCLARLGKTDEALKCFLKVIEAAPTYAEAHYELAMPLLAAGRAKVAIAGLGETCDTAPGMPTRIASLDSP